MHYPSPCVQRSRVEPTKEILVDKLLSESVALYSIDTKKAVSEREFSLSDIILIADIVEHSGTTQDSVDSVEQYNQQKPKYACPDCGIVFENKLDYRKHDQAFHDSIKEPNLFY